MFILYDIIFLIFAIFSLPILIWKGKLGIHFWVRLGFFPPELKNLAGKKNIWLHAVSVGEVASLRLFVQELKKKFPEYSLILSTVTPTGNTLAKQIFTQEAVVTYLPLDFSFIIRRAIGLIRPSLFVIAETELWPNLISELYRQKIPTVIINGRISDRSFPSYYLGRFFFKPLLRRVSLCLMQTEKDAERVEKIGAPKDKIFSTGNMKFDAAKAAEIDSVRLEKIKALVGKNKSKCLFLAASTHPGEEEAILEIYLRLLADYPDLSLMLAPRHIERANELSSLVTRLDFKPIRISLLDGHALDSVAKKVAILDTIGDLAALYSLADVIFMGGSLVKKGGHNLIEPAIQSRSFCFGPQMFNFRDMAQIFLDGQSCAMVKDKDELEKTVRFFLEHPAEAKQMGERARKIVEKNQGATLRNVEFIKELLA
jgi:3-deoxy-D-manno-octulosonic-acid transferase